MSEEHQDYYQQHAEQISAHERQVLKEHEPFIEFHVKPDAGLSQGRQSRVSVLEYERGGETYQVLWKRMAAGKGLSAQEATVFNQRLQPYRRSLIGAGWNVPKVLYSKVIGMPREYQIFSYEQFIPGGDGEKLYKNDREPNFRKWYLIEEVVRILYAYDSASLQRGSLAGQDVTRLPHGLDLKLANCVLEQGSDTLFFVDLFGPKELTPQGNWLTYSPKLDSLPEEPLMAVCASREGAILRCWRLAEAHWAGASQDTGELRREFLSRLATLGLPPDELTMITEEIAGGYSWLDSIYQEGSV